VWFTSPLGVVGVDPPTSTRGAALAFRRLWLAAPDRIAFEVDGLRAGTARVEAFDVAGRRLGAATVTSGVAGAGSGTIALGAAARSGIVLVRVRQDGLVAVRRLAMIR
jgi:hypothetical protein